MNNVEEDILVRIGSGDLFSIGSHHDGSVFSGGNGSPTKAISSADGELLRLVTSLQRRVQELERNAGIHVESDISRFRVETESVGEEEEEPSLASASSDDSLEIPHVSL